MFWGLLKRDANVRQHGLVGIVQVGSQRHLASDPTIILMLAFNVVSLVPGLGNGDNAHTWRTIMRIVSSPALVKMLLLLFCREGSERPWFRESM